MLDTFAVKEADDPLTPDITERLRYNGDDSTVYGGELNIGYFADNWDIQFSWVQQSMRFDTADGEEGIEQRDFYRNPESLGQISFTHEGSWCDTFINCKATGSMDIPHETAAGWVKEESDWFFTVDLGLRKKITLANESELTLNLGIKNIFNEYQDDLDYGVDRDPGYIYGPAFPRTVHAGLSYTF